MVSLLKKAGDAVGSVTNPIKNSISNALGNNTSGQGGNVGSGGAFGGLLNSVHSAINSALPKGTSSSIPGTPADKATKAITTQMSPAGKAGAAVSAAGGGTGDPVLDTINKFLPNYKSPLDANGNLADKYKVNAGPAVSADKVTADKITPQQLDVNGLMPNQDALNLIKQKAMATGPSAWADLANKQVDLNTLTAKDNAAAQAMSGAAAARSALAMHGGLGGGAAERLAMGTSRDMNAAKQAAERAGNEGKLSIGMQDEANKNNMLMAVPGMDLANAGFKSDLNKFNIGTAMDADKFNTGLAFDASKTNAANNLAAGEFNSGQNFAANQTNVTNALAGLGGENKFNMDKFQTQMMGYGASKAGNAIQNGGKK